MATTAAAVARPELVNGAGRFAHVNVLEFKALEQDTEQRVVSGYASTPDIDSMDEVVLPSAFEQDLLDYMRIPLVTWMHDTSQVPIGHTEKAEVRPDGLFVSIRVNHTALGEQVWQALSDKSLHALSIGYDGKYNDDWGTWHHETNVWVWHRVKLLEIAFVSLPANRFATLQLSRSLGLAEVARPMEYATWEDAACAAYEFARARDGKQGPGVVARLEETYRRFERQFPEGLGAAELWDVTWHENEMTVYEQRLCLTNTRKLKGLSEGVRNITASWARRGDTVPANIAEQLVSARAYLAEIPLEEPKPQTNAAAPSNDGDQFVKALVGSWASGSAQT